MNDPQEQIKWQVFAKAVRGFLFLRGLHGVHHRGLSWRVHSRKQPVPAG